VAEMTHQKIKRITLEEGWSKGNKFIGISSDAMNVDRKKQKCLNMWIYPFHISFGWGRKMLMIQFIILKVILSLDISYK